MNVNFDSQNILCAGRWLWSGFENYTDVETILVAHTNIHTLKHTNIYLYIFTSAKPNIDNKTTRKFL